jgi:hypothetical protein
VITRHPTPELGGHIDALLGNYDAHTCAAGPTCRLLDSGEHQVLAR